jgi:hemolysin activation/secretion protein
VRSYPQGEGVGDSGLLGTIELRRTMSALGPFARPQLIAFFDGGRIHTNKNVFLPVENARNLYGAGVGLNLLTQGGFAIRGALAWRLGHEPALSDTDSASRVWVQMGKSF